MNRDGVRADHEGFARPEVLATPPVTHGAFDYEELGRRGIEPRRLLDFSVNGNPYGPSPAARAALSGVPLELYPDREALSLRRALAEHLGVSTRRILAGNGTSELIWLVALAFVRPGDGVLVVGPTYGEYGRAVALMGGRVLEWRACEEDGFAPKPGRIEAEIRRSSAQLVFACNPNNPTGAATDPREIRLWAERHPRTLFVVDEAYLRFAEGLPSAAQAGCDNILVLRSMTKDYGLAGVRLGYALAPPELIETLARVRPPWSVNAYAQAAGVGALSDEPWLAETLGKLASAKEKLWAEMGGIGIPPLPSATHFCLVRAGNGAMLRRRLMNRGILVRDCASFGLAAWVRVAARRPEENAGLIQAARAALREGMAEEGVSR